MLNVDMVRSVDMVRLGVDPGTRRIGLALSEPDTGMAYPHCTLEVSSGEAVARKVAAEAVAEGVGEIVIGLPLHLDGTEGQAARRARTIAREVGKLTGLPVVLWDERLSSVAAERSLREAQVGGRQRRRVVDQVAATLLLQSYLDAKTERAWNEDGTHLPPTKTPRRRRRGDPDAGERS